MIRARGDRTWVRRRPSAVAARAGAVAIPAVTAVLLASIGLFALHIPAPGWQLAWQTGMVLASCLAALCCEPLSRRLWTLAILLELDVEFPSRAPSRPMVAVRASGIAALQWRLVATARDHASDDLVSARMATASALGALRVQRLHDTHNARLTATVAFAACTALVVVLVSPGTAPDSTRETAEAPARAAPPAPVTSNDAPPRATPTEPASSPAPTIPRAAPFPEMGAPAQRDAESTARADPAPVASQVPSPAIPEVSSDASTQRATPATSSSSPGAAGATDAARASVTSPQVSSGTEQGTASIANADIGVSSTISRISTTSTTTSMTATQATSSVPPPAAIPSLDGKAQRVLKDGTIGDATESSPGAAVQETTDAPVTAGSRPEGVPSRPEDAPGRATSATAQCQSPCSTSLDAVADQP